MPFLCRRTRHCKKAKRPRLRKRYNKHVGRKIVLLGATGSIGTQTVDVVRRLGAERAQIIALSARRNVGLLAEQARETGAIHVAVTDENELPALQAVLPDGIHTHGGEDSLTTLATLPEADTVVVAVAGAAALSATLAAARAGKRLCIATKEVLVAAGELVMRTARENDAEILPIDSEHSALFQCVQGYRVPEDIAHLYITASGGPFRTWSREQIEAATIEDALKHPTWRMGGKITIDSATLMNKGLEIIEACHLFGVPLEHVSVVVHPQSVVHSLAEMTDGALLAQLGLPDMRLPIQIALTHPEKSDIELPRLKPAQMGNLSFEEPDQDRFPAIGLARTAFARGGTTPATLNAANEAAVAAFLDGKIAFTDICRLVGQVTESHLPKKADTLEAVLAADSAARQAVRARLDT
ncbi:MAG: 1-deoxy-D-xylulose-5-phosphate reductoisomerase [Fibrella sp.]|nr:1-deoxy-D-xylulose-5-phosphate reductoisomerase [Armatimonadota bacterium]